MLENAKAALRVGDLDSAESIAREGLLNESQRGAASSILAAIALQRGNPLESLEWSARALELGQEDVMTLSNAGEAYRRIGEFQKAADHFEKALKIDNLNALLHFNMAVVMRQMGNAPLAEHFFRSAQIADPGMWQAYSNLAELYRDEAHVNEAEAEYRHAIRCNPKEARPMERLGSLLLERGNTMEAVDFLEAANRLSGGTADSLFDLAKAYFELCYELPARTALSNALAISSPSPEAPHLVAEVVRRESFESMRGAHGVFGVLARERRLHVSSPHTLPLEESANFILGIPHAPEVFWARMKNVRILPGEFSIFTDEKRLYIDGIVNWAQFYRQRGVHVHHESDDMRILLKVPRQCREVKEQCALLGGAGDWFAWVYECIPRLWTIEQHRGLERIKLIVPEDLSLERIEMLEQFGVRADRLIRQAATECLLVSDLFVPSLLTVGDWISPIALQYLRRRLSRSEARAPFRKVFAYRSSDTGLALKNREEICARLLSEGFEAVDMSSLAFAERVRIISESAVFIGMDADELALMPVLPQGAWVGAISPRGRYHLRSHLVSNQLGINLVYLFGDPHFEDDRALDQCDVLMPMEVLNSFLSRIS